MNSIRIKTGIRERSQIVGKTVLLSSGLREDV